ncbi:triacylglycerol lipase-like protein [Medicago truncatula]|uniref:Triacylglycerol lipase-like protein n=1 Tax=Medicago truncatula TaxID=3880 RepID=G7KNP0_MEDTR|nr:triacylglycerol lipase-like protein [Medicago truncatula]
MQYFQVITKDGYILSIQRIPEGRSEAKSNVTKKKEPVIVQHGVFVDGATWFLNSPKQNLPMILANNGFDVWIPNTRGTKFSRKHTSLDPSNKTYWDWSWDELVTYEMPAIFDFISKQTGGQKIHYVGHSLGTLTALASLAEGKWENQVKSVALLSPVAYLSQMKSILGQIAARSLLSKGYILLRIPEFDVNVLPIVDFIKGICAHPGVNCNELFTALTGENCCLAPSAFNQFMEVGRQSTSARNMFHLAQNVQSGVLTKFDFMSPHLNFWHYGRPTPPVYNLSNIPKNVPIFMSYGGRDALSDVADVKRLLNQHFQNHEADKLSVQFIDNYAHADYAFGVNANDLVYNNVTSFFKRQW